MNLRRPPKKGPPKIENINPKTNLRNSRRLSPSRFPHGRLPYLPEFSHRRSSHPCSAITDFSPPFESDLAGRSLSAISFAKVKISGVMLRSLYGGLSHPFRHVYGVRYLSTSSFSGNGSSWNQNSNSLEPADEFERRIFGGSGSGSGNGSNADPFFRKLDKLESARGGWRPTRRISFGDDFRLERTRGGWRPTRVNDYEDDSEDDLDETFSTLSDGMEEKLKDAATYFEMDDDQIAKGVGDEDEFEYEVELRDGEEFSFHPQDPYEELEDQPDEYDIKDLDVRRPFIEKPRRRREEFKVSTEEALRRADFRNVRFLANFITEAGILKKRSQTGISAKAQRKIAREIKTARAFGLMPFTTMGTKSFIFGRSMENSGEDYEYRNRGPPMAYTLDVSYEKDPLEG
ncbi:hypothetical protein SLE2022_390880 [Rubroshorea leprosula]